MMNFVLHDVRVGAGLVPKSARFVVHFLNRHLTKVRFIFRSMPCLRFLTGIRLIEVTPRRHDGVQRNSCFEGGGKLRKGLLGLPPVRAGPRGPFQDR